MNYRKSSLVLRDGWEEEEWLILEPCYCLETSPVRVGLLGSLDLPDSWLHSVQHISTRLFSLENYTTDSGSSSRSLTSV